MAKNTLRTPATSAATATNAASAANAVGRSRRRSSSPRTLPSAAATVALASDDPSVIERISLTPDARLLLTPEEVARRLSIGRTLCYRLLTRGDIASLLIGKARRVPVSALDAYIHTLANQQGVQL